MRNHRHAAVAILALLIGASGCQKGTSKDNPAVGSGSNMGSAKGSGAVSKAGSAAGSGSSAPIVEADIDSKDILARTETTPEVYVKHVMIGWKELVAGRGARADKRAAERSNADAAKLAQDVAAKLKAKPESIDELMQQSSEDMASVQSGDPYLIKADGPFVAEFKNLAIRLKEKEVGLVKTRSGYHVVMRVSKPPPDPIESADILARAPESTGTVQVQHILIGWKDTMSSKSGAGDKRAMARTKADADKLATEVLAKVRAKGDMAKLMKEFSEDPGSKDNAKVFDIAGEVPPGFEAFKNLAVRLKLNEAGIAKTQLGLHVVKRVPPPPPPAPDSLESADILKREPVTQKAKVKHILLGWTEVHADDERGKKRDRATLEKLVKATEAKLKKGDKIEPLMAELSEDTGSAKSGISYDVTPDAGLVPPFKNLSLRLKLNEVGVVKTDFGIHIIQRVE